MSALLTDTNVASILFRPNHPLYRACVALVDNHELFISFMSRAELVSWPRLNSWGPKRTAELFRHVDLFTTLYPDGDTCEIWVDVRLRCRRIGRGIGVADAWIAATSLQWDMPLVTDDVRDFERVQDLSLIPVR